MLLVSQVFRRWVCAAALAYAAEGAEGLLEAQFAEPPQNETRASVALRLDLAGGDAEAFARQLERAREAGAGGVLVTVPTADEAVWGQLVKAAERCRQLGLELGVRDFSAGTQEVASATYARKLVWSSCLEGAGEPAAPEGPHVPQAGRSHQELARLAVPVAARVQPSQIVDLTLASLPTNGAWRVFQFGLDDVAPPLLDWFDERQVARHVNGLLFELQRRLKRTYGTTFLWCQMERAEGAELLWPRDLPEAFRKRSGLGLERYLPALAGVAVGDEATAAHVRMQVAQTVCELWRSRYAGQVNELVHEAGLDAGIGIGGLPVAPEEVAVYFKRPLLVPSRSEAQHAANVRAAGGARTQGRRYIVGQVDLAAVSATAASEILPFSCKHEVDRLLCEGATRLLFETGGTLSGGDAPFVALRDACRYAHRCQVLLQQGEPASDFLVWSQEPLPLLEGYGCDYANQAMLESAAVKGDRIRFDSERTYGRLAVSRGVLASKSAQRLARQMSAKGVQVWVVGNGLEAPGDGADAVGKPMRAAADCGVLPDFEWRSEVEAMWVRFAHRRMPDLDVYFVANTSDAGGLVNCTFRDVGKGAVERWNPVDGEIRSLPRGAADADGRLSVPLLLSPRDACFIVFGG